MWMPSQAISQTGASSNSPLSLFASASRDNKVAASRSFFAGIANDDWVLNGLQSQFFTRIRSSVPLQDSNSQFWARNLGKVSWRKLNQSYVPTSTLSNIIMTPAPYCLKCEFPFKEMGACPRPDTSILYAYISLLPYLIPLAYLAASPFTRSITHLKLFILPGLAYIVGDRMLKNIFLSPRPEFACKSSYGMPSSHMVVMVAYCFHQIWYSNSRVWEKVLWLLLTIAEGFARTGLNYHTLQQVIGGVIFGVIFTLLFEWCWSRCQHFFQSVPILKAIFNRQKCKIKQK